MYSSFVFTIFTKLYSHYHHLTVLMFISFIIEGNRHTDIHRPPAVSSCSYPICSSLTSQDCWCTHHIQVNSRSEPQTFPYNDANYAYTTAAGPDCRTILSPHQRIPKPIGSHYSFNPKHFSLTQPSFSCLFPGICLFWIFHINGAIHDLALCDWFCSLSMFSQFITESSTSCWFISVYEYLTFLSIY